MRQSRVGQTARAPGFGCPRWYIAANLRQVVAERGFEYVVGTVRVATGVCRTARAGPEVALEVAVLRSLAETAHRPTIEVIPVAGSQFLDVLGLVAAVGWGGRSEASTAAEARIGCRAWPRFDVASAHVGKR